MTKYLVGMLHGAAATALWFLTFMYPNPQIQPAFAIPAALLSLLALMLFARLLVETWDEKS